MSEEKEWQVKCAFLESRLKEADEAKQCLLRDAERLSTLLKASEGMKRALRSIYQDRLMGDCQASTSYVYEYENIARKALADFRAVKEGL